MRAFVVLALALASVSAGCALAPQRQQAAPTFHLVLVENVFRAGDDVGPLSCGEPTRVRVDAANRTLTFARGAAPPTDMQALVLFVTWSGDGCGNESLSWSTSQRWNGEFATTGDEASRLLMRDDGLLSVGGDVVPAGGEHKVTRSGTLADRRSFVLTERVRDLGAWPVSGVRAGA